MREENAYFVYILASYKNGTLYIGLTSDLIGRVHDHKNKIHPNSFTAKYNVHRLVYYEQFEDIDAAIDREKFLKKQKRAYKIRRIERENPHWEDLYPQISEFLF